MDQSEKKQLVDELVRLATDDATSVWPARLYLAAALWLESEREPDGDDRTLLTIAAERVRKKGTDDPPEGFRSFVSAWLGELVDGARR